MYISNQVKSQSSKNPKDGAKRKRDHDRKKRQQGLKEFRAWVTTDEARDLQECLAKLRGT